MGKFTDENGVKWDIRTTTAQSGTSPAVNTWFAAIDEGPENDDYSANKFALVDEKTFDGKGGQTTVITWPTGGNPILRGPGTEADALTSVRAFAARQKSAGLKNVMVKITAKPPNTPAGDNMLALVLLVAVVLLADKR